MSDKSYASSFLIKSNKFVHSTGSHFQLEYLNPDDDSETQPVFGQQPPQADNCTPYNFYIHSTNSTDITNNGYRIINSDTG